jgi:hypothetical protein
LARSKKFDRCVWLVVSFKQSGCFESKATSSQVFTTIAGQLQRQRTIDTAESNPTGNGVSRAVVYFAANHGIGNDVCHVTLPPA